ncbi:MAG: GNAT family N-acetyltransferase [Lachnospiraceae bacterium]|nr:GNAT family N-acetyltransferase [Lachnospiraceae bacterium]
MTEESKIQIRPMALEDYDQVYRLWKTIRGFAIRSVDDSREGIERFLRRNPTTSIVAVYQEEVVGAILCGHDGRRGCFYHVCVKEEHRQNGIGKQMAVAAMEALRAEHISKVNLIAFRTNEVGNQFWKRVGWTFREDLNYYDFTLNEENLIYFNQ